MEIKKNRLKKESHENEETKLYSRNFINGINAWTDSHVRYAGPFLMLMREEIFKNEPENKKT